MKLPSKQGGNRVRPGLVLLLAALMPLWLSPSAFAQRHGSGGAQWQGHSAGVHPSRPGSANFSGGHPFNRGSANFSGGRRFNGAPGNNAGFRHRDGAPWRGGHWTHGRHDGRVGWWWVAGGLWSWYPAPIYPYPYEPAVVAIYDLPPPAQYWYYCAALGAYYPYVATCPGGWTEVLATPAQVAPLPVQ